MKQTKTFMKSLGVGWPEHEYFKHDGKEVAVFQNITGSWTASGAFRQVEAATKEEAIAKYKEQK